MKKTPLLLLTLALCACSQFEMASRRVEGYPIFRSELESGQHPSYELVDIEQLKSMAQDSTFIISWNPWCPHSLSVLDQLNYRADSIQTPYLLVTASYDLKSINKKLQRRPWLAEQRLYILDGRKHGETELERMKSLSKALVDTALTRSPVFYLKQGGAFQLSNNNSFNALR